MLRTLIVLFSFLSPLVVGQFARLILEASRTGDLPRCYCHMHSRVPPYGPDREQVEAAKRTIEQTRREMAELESQIWSSKETIAKSEKLLARLKALLPQPGATKPEDSA